MVWAGHGGRPLPTEGRGLLAWCLRRQPRRLAAAIAGGTVFQLCSVVFPLCVRYAIDEGITPGDMAATTRWAVVVVLIGIVLVAGLAVMQWFITTLAVGVTNEVRGALLGQAFRMDRRAIDGFGRGDLAVRGTRDVDLVQLWLSGFASLVTGCFGFLVILTLIGMQDGVLAVVGLATVPFLVGLHIVLPRQFDAANTRLSSAHARRADVVEELLSASAAVRGIAGEGPLVDRHAERSAQVTVETMSTARVAASWAAGAPFIPGMAIAVGLLVGGQAVLAGTLTIGGLVAFTSWMTMLGVWVGVLTSRFTQLAEAVTAAKRITEMLSTESTMTEARHPVELPERAPLHAAGVGVNDPRGGTVGPFDFTARPGELVAVAGPLASGKSLLLRLLTRWDDPDFGAVSLGEVDLRDASLAALRRRLVLVPQRPNLVSGSVLDNLRLGRPERSDEDIEAACRRAAINEYLRSLPDGYGTEVGEGGSTLSGGELQRLALAGALLHGGEVLVLDDITSAVDAGTEARMLAGLRIWLAEAPDERMIVFATHRDAVMAEADRLIRLPEPLRGKESESSDRLAVEDSVG